VEDNIFEAITTRFHFRFKNRVTAANMLGELLRTVLLKKEEKNDAIILGIPSAGVIAADIVAKKVIDI
jgi:predicted phosphoribosyltransferase